MKKIDFRNHIPSKVRLNMMKNDTQMWLGIINAKGIIILDRQVDFLVMKYNGAEYRLLRTVSDKIMDMYLIYEAYHIISEKENEKNREEVYPLVFETKTIETPNLSATLLKDGTVSNYVVDGYPFKDDIALEFIAHCDILEEQAMFIYGEFKKLKPIGTF